MKLKEQRKLSKRELMASLFAVAVAAYPISKAEAAFQSNAVLTVPSKDLLKALVVPIANQTVQVLYHTTAGDGGGGLFTVTTVNPGADNGGTIIHSNTAGYYWVRNCVPGLVFVDWFGADNTGVAFSDTAILAAIASLRKNMKNIWDGLTANVDAYTSGTVKFSGGIYKSHYDVFNITQDLGLILEGQGSRGTNNAIRAPTTWVFSGASGATSYGIQFYGNGSRSAQINNMDICYENNTFSGQVVAACGSPGFSPNFAFFGTYKIAGPRDTTAQCGIAISFDEFFRPNRCVFDGLQYGILSDDTRVVGANTFGGSATTILDCVFYDIVQASFYHSGARARISLNIYGGIVNPININCVYGYNFTNITDFIISGVELVGSVGNYATTTWINVAASSGIINGCYFGDFSPTGATLDGNISLAGNFVDTVTNGFLLKAGTIKSSNNRITKPTNGYAFSATNTTTVELGPDRCDSSVVTSYNFTGSGANVYGKVNYSKEWDASTNGFANDNLKVTIANADRGTINNTTVGTTAISIKDTGRTLRGAAAGAQTFTLPTPMVGTSLRFTHVDQDLSVTGTLAAGGGALKAQAKIVAADVGGAIEFVAFSTAAWTIVSSFGTWAIT